jgi:hypothetical protein
MTGRSHLFEISFVGGLMLVAVHYFF